MSTALKSPKTVISGFVYTTVTRDSDSLIWSLTSGFLALNGALWSGYAAPLSTVSGTGYYQGSLVSGISDSDLYGNSYTVEYFLAVSGLPSVTLDYPFGVQFLGNTSGGALLASGQQVVLASNGADLVMIESGMNLRQSQSIIAAGVAGRFSGAGTLNVRIDGANASGVNRIAGTVDASGNRTAITLNLPA